MVAALAKALIPLNLKISQSLGDFGYHIFGEYLQNSESKPTCEVRNPEVEANGFRPSTHQACIADDALSEVIEEKVDH